MKKIAIDARPLSSQLTGIGRYLYNVLREILEADPVNHYYLYSSEPLLFDFTNNPNVHIRVLPTKSKIGELIVSQILFPIWATQDKIDTFWSPRHHLPLLLSLSKSMKKVVTIHDIVWFKHPETMSKGGLIIEKLFFYPSLRISDKIITLSNFTKTELCQNLSISENKIITTGIGCFHGVSEGECCELDIEGRYLLFVGTLEPRKNLPNILRAFQKFCLTNADTDLILVGKKGWGNRQVGDIIEELNLTDRVKQLGYVDDNCLTYLYKNCEILLMPSIYEGFGLPALEALSYKKKVIVTKNSAIAEMEGNNIFISDTSSESILSAINLSINIIPSSYSKIEKSWLNPALTTIKILL